MKSISFNKIKALSDDLSDKIKKSGKKFDAIIGIPRGGLIPATLISHKLGIPYLEDKHAVSSGSKILVIDEFVDTGKTLKSIKETNNHYTVSNDVEYTYAALIVRNTAPRSLWPDFYSWIIEHKEWITFEYEVEKETPKSWAN